MGDRKWGMICLCGYLVLECLSNLTNVKIEYSGMLAGVLAGAAAVLMFMDK